MAGDTQRVLVEKAPNSGWMHWEAVQRAHRRTSTGHGPHPWSRQDWDRGCGATVADLMRRMRTLCQRRIVTCDA